MSVTSRISPAASVEFSEAVRWYDTRRSGLGGEFFDAVVSPVSQIETNAELGTTLSRDGHTRRVLVARFPYQVVYRIRQAEIVIVAIAHLKRRPGYWKHRG